MDFRLDQEMAGRVGCMEKRNLSSSCQDIFVKLDRFSPKKIIGVYFLHFIPFYKH